ncbi:MAG: LuxR C-terminal-related transcriptional regulator [Cyclobacteriaceae bacterium]
MFETLTNREQQILDMILKEFTSSEIAKELGISLRTVETHRKNINHKTGTKSLVGLVKKAMMHRLMEQGISI